MPGAFGFPVKWEGESRMMGNYQVRFGGSRGVFQQWTPPRLPYSHRGATRWLYFVREAVP